MNRPSLAFSRNLAGWLCSRGVFDRRIGSVLFWRISIVGVLGQEVLGIGTRISRGLGSRSIEYPYVPRQWSVKRITVINCFMFVR